MGCCIGINQNRLPHKEYIINLGQKEIEDLIEDNSIYSSEKKIRKHTSKTDVTNYATPKKKAKTGKYYNQRTKDIVKNLRLIAKSEVKNIRKFFVLK